MKKLSILAIFIITFFSFVACNRSEGGQDAKSSQGGQVAMNATDSTITSEVEKRFQADDSLSASAITVDTVNGIVNLRGSVATQDAADHAIAVAHQVENVRDVRSFLKVPESTEPSSTVSQLGQDVKDGAEKAGTEIKKGAAEAKDLITDATITADIKLKFADDKLVSATAINIDTKDGVVTLNGIVASRAEEKRAITIARKVDGVKNVHSNLTIQS